MGSPTPPLQQPPHGLIENRIAPQRQHITYGKHITLTTDTSTNSTNINRLEKL